MEEEMLIWKGSPSQWVNFKAYFWCFLFCWLVIPVFIALWKYFIVKTKKIKITSQRIIEEKGIFSKTTDELELYRVKDIRLHQPFFYRLVGLSTIILATSDKTDPIVNIAAIKKGRDIREKLRIAVDVRRDIKGVREADLE